MKDFNYVCDKCGKSGKLKFYTVKLGVKSAEKDLCSECYDSLLSWFRTPSSAPQAKKALFETGALHYIEHVDTTYLELLKKFDWLHGYWDKAHGVWLSNYLSEAGLSQSKFASLLGVRQCMISVLCRGMVEDPRSDIRYRLHDYFVHDTLK